MAIYTSALISRLNQVQSNLVKAEKSKIETLKKVDQMKSKFFANISHEFRTPIAIAMANLESLDSKFKTTNIDKDSIEKLKTVHRSQRKLLSLINDILTLEKLEQSPGEIKLMLVPDIGRYVKQRVEAFTDLAKSKGVDLVVNINITGQTKVFADVDLLDIVISNLLSNAIKFTEKGNVTVETSLEDNFWIFSVKDSGIGIREDQIDKVFDRFQQASGSEPKDPVGTGIGLSLVKESIESHHGNVGVESEYGKGARFWFKLPIAQENITATKNEGEILVANVADFNHELSLDNEDSGDILGQKRANEWNAKVEKERVQGKPTIIFVDDNSDLRDFFSNNFSKIFNVFLGVDGKHGFYLFQKHKPDLIISDDMMPKMSGRQLLQKVREKTNEIPFIILTANIDSEVKLEALRLGANDFLYKPFHTEEVVTRIDNHLKIKKQRDRIEADITAAQGIQQSLLPNSSSSEFPGIKLEALFQPSEKLSGDFYGYYSHESQFITYLADVTSHGVASAQVTYIVKSIFDELIKNKKGKFTATELMRDFGEKYQEQDINYGVALQILIFDQKEMKVEYSAAGTPSAYHCEGNNISEIYISKGPYLHPQFLNKEALNKITNLNFSVKPRDKIFLLTDGVFAISPEGEELRSRSLKRKLISLSDGLEWRKQLLQYVHDYEENDKLRDDLTVIRLVFN